MLVISRQPLLTSVSAGLLVVALACSAFSQEVIIDSPTTGPVIILGLPNHTLIIRENGSVSTTGAGAYAVSSAFSGSKVTNNGVVQTSGDYAHGIYNSPWGSGAVLTNNGVVRTRGQFSDGISNAGPGATIFNTGNIVTTGYGSAGIAFNADATTIINTGAIYSAREGIYQFNTASDAVFISNSGIIVSEGNVIDIETQNSKVINTGRIRAIGTTDHRGIFTRAGTSNTEISNSGSIVSENGRALQIRGSGNAVTLHAPSYLGGRIAFNSETSLNIETGASHSVLWQLPTTNVAGGQANISGPVPWFYDSTTGQFATFDPTGLTASFNQMANTANMLGRLARYGLRQAGRAGSAAPAALAYGEDGTQSSEGFDVLLATNSGPESAYGLKAGSFWLTGFGGEANYDGDDATLDYSIDQIGAALGYAWAQSPEMRLGFMLGYMNGSITATSPWADSQDITSNGIFAGVHGDRRFGPVTFGLGLAGGWQTNDSSRFVNDNTALTGGLTLGESTAGASYDSWFVTPEAALSADIALGRTGIVLTPSLRGRYALQQTGSYTETGSSANAAVDSHTFGVAEGDFELAVSRSLGLATLSGRAGYLVRSSTGDDDVPVTLLGITNSIGLGATDRSAAYLGAGLDLTLGPQASFNLDGQGYLSDDVNALEGMARLTIRF